MTPILKHLILCILLISISCSNQKSGSDSSWEVLFDGTSLENWDTYIGPTWIEGEGREDMQNKTPQGLNNDLQEVFTIYNLNDENVLRISGENWGGISTKKEYENYHLKFDFRWGDLKWYPRNKPEDKRDSGLLYHGNGPHGIGDGFWLRSQELQIQEGDCGDYWGVAGAQFDIRATRNEAGIFQYNQEGELLTFSVENENGRHCKKYPDNENPSGEWNTIELYCFGDSAIHIVNGKVTMVLNSSKQNVEGIVKPLTKGKIQFQSESAEVYYRNIRIREIVALPDFVF